MAKKAVVLTTILRLIYLPVRPLNISPACIDKHCFAVRSLRATTWQLNDSFRVITNYLPRGRRFALAACSMSSITVELDILRDYGEFYAHDACLDRYIVRF